MKQNLAAIATALVLLGLIGTASLKAEAYWTESKSIGFSGSIGSLSMDCAVNDDQTCADIVDLGSSILPGQSGSFVVTVKNTGTVSGQVSFEQNPEGTGYLKMQFDDGCDQKLNPGDMCAKTVTWELPTDTNLGSGGQTLSGKILVSLTQ